MGWCKINFNSKLTNEYIGGKSRMNQLACKIIICECDNTKRARAKEKEKEK